VPVPGHLGRHSRCALHDSSSLVNIWFPPRSHCHSTIYCCFFFFGMHACDGDLSYGELRRWQLARWLCVLNGQYIICVFLITQTMKVFIDNIWLQVQHVKSHRSNPLAYTIVVTCGSFHV
jgi:hypothetical protein